MPPEKYNCTACGFSGSKRAVSTHISQRQDENHGGERGHFEGYKALMEKQESPDSGTEEGTDKEGTTVETDRSESKDGDTKPEESTEEGTEETSKSESGDSGNGVLSLLEKYGILEI